jgi:hypothetical protein
VVEREWAVNPVLIGVLCYVLLQFAVGAADLH